MKRRVKLGDIEFTVVESEKPSDVVTITDNSVETGQDVSDHVKRESSIIEIQGQMMGNDAAEKLNKLQVYQREGKLLTYIGRNIYTNMAIQTFDRDHGVGNRYGFSFNITLKQVRIATAKEVEIKVANPVTKKPSKKTKAKVKKKTNNGKQQPKKKAVSQSSTSKPSQYIAPTQVSSYLKIEQKKSPVEKMNSIATSFGVPPRPKKTQGGRGKF